MTTFRLYCVPRSGSTMLLRSLDAHPQITAVGAGFSRAPSETGVSVIKDDRNPPDGPGLVLIRNPLAVYASWRRYQAEHGGWSIQDRLRRWGKPLGIRPTGDDLDDFCRFWVARYESVRDCDRFPAEPPCWVYKYEDVVQRPNANFVGMCIDLMVKGDWDSIRPMLNAHGGCAPGTDIHAGNMGDRPIDTNSLDRWQDELSAEQVTRIVVACRATAATYGYDLPALTRAARATR